MCILEESTSSTLLIWTGYGKVVIMHEETFQSCKWYESRRQSYFRSLIGCHILSILWYISNDLEWPSSRFQGYVVYNIAHLENNAIFSERELTFTFAICYRPSVCRLSVVCLSVCLSVTLVHPTQAVQIFRNISTAFGTLAIRWHPLKISRRSSQGNPSAGGVKHKRGSKI